jgi:tyrosine-protein phosphatase SIW14
MVRRISLVGICAALLGASCFAAGGCAAGSPDAGPRPLADRIVKPAPVTGVGNFAWVSPVLCRGEQPTAEGFRELERMGVRTVVNLRSQHDDRTMLSGTSLGYVRIPCSAWGVDREHLRQFLAIVNDPALQPVFVHCQHGADRTGFVVAGYRMVEMEWDAHSAETELRGFGFHAIWARIPAQLLRLDVASLRGKGMPPRAEPAGTAPGVKA